jgi:lipopolysaccharide export system permease protein
MRLVDRYIGRTVAVNTLVVMLVLLALYFFTTLVDEMGDVGKAKYTTLDAIEYSVLMLPRLAYELFPLGALLGSMLGLGALASSSELTVIRAAGVSVWRIVLSVLKVGVVMMAVMMVLGEAVAPPAEEYARIQRAQALSERISVNTDYGLWARDGNTFVNIRRLLSQGRLSKIYLYQYDGQQRLRRIVFARDGRYRHGLWQLSRVDETVFGDDRVTVRHEAKREWRSSLTPEVFNIVSMPPEKLSIWDLAGYVSYLQSNGLDASAYQVALWNRVMMPFATAGMVLMAIPFVFGSLRTVGVGQRIMVGVLLGIVFYLFNAIFTRFGLVYGLAPFVSAALPTVAVFAAWAGLMRKIR